ncbi:leucine-rich repeat-containing protein 40-like [Clavelina lepadiformis]|uniref:leucine-rich repeat-containing protein 40-like n=1 Tax=Clavelina lepadiformis TaxID=159417 RepID=UPI004042F7ED
MTSIPQAIFKQARKSGVLNLSNRNLEAVPAEVWRLNLNAAKDARESAASFDAGERWWDQVELTKLNLSSNQITSLSDELSNFQSLIVLDVHDNKLASLPSNLADLPNLKRFDVSHNNLQSLPSLEYLKVVSAMLLHYNQLSELPPSIGAMESCELLDASNNLLTSVPATLSSMKNLRSINLSKNNIATLPASFGEIRSLKIVNLNDNGLKSMPNSIENLCNLEQLYLRNNSLATLPSLQKCACLKEIYAGNNMLKFVPKNLPESISMLELRENKISDVGIDITNITSLERLDIANNNVSNLPPEIGNMQNIKILVLDGNPLRSIRRDVINQGTQAVMNYLRSRIVVAETPTNRKPQESALPQSDQQQTLSRKHAMANTGKLNLSKSNVSCIESGLQEASGIALTDLDLSKSMVSEVPMAVFMFSPTLVSLNLSMNKLTCIQIDIGLMSKLTHLNLSSNALTLLPDEVRSLRSLIEINLCCNKFTEVPPTVYELESLEHLLFDSNKMTKIDVENLKKLKNLSTLSLQYNNIGQVPPELSLLEKLQTLKLEGNTFRVPRQNIMAKGSAAVLEYLRSRIPP